MSGSLSACLERLTGEGNAEMAEAGTDTSSSSEEGSLEVGEGNDELRRIDQLERELSVSPMLYDKHVELITLLAGEYLQYLQHHAHTVLARRKILVPKLTFFHFLFLSFYITSGIKI